MGTEHRITIHGLTVLKVFLDDPTVEHYGLALAKRAGLKTSSVYPVLMRLEQTGWVTSSWETVEPSEAGRPRRRLYRLTDSGAVAAYRQLTKARNALAIRSPTRKRVGDIRQPGAAT